ncbi:MAG: hypothetical protein ACLFMX_08355 [Halobacteriales archaeon]
MVDPGAVRRGDDAVGRRVAARRTTCRAASEFLEDLPSEAVGVDLDRGPDHPARERLDAAGTAGGVTGSRDPLALAAASTAADVSRTRLTATPPRSAVADAAFARWSPTRLSAGPPRRAIDWDAPKRALASVIPRVGVDQR